MGWIIGMDEAGYGPNLGPLVVTATVWDVPGDPRRFDFWGCLQEVVSRSAPNAVTHLHVADSKQVYTPSRGLGNLERAVLSVLRSCIGPVHSFRQLSHLLTRSRTNVGVAGVERDHPTPICGRLVLGGARPPDRRRLGVRRAQPQPSIRRDSPFLAEPWFENDDVPLPSKAQSESIEEWASRFVECCHQHGIALRAVKSDIVLTKRFNRLTREFDSKGAVLSRISLRLLRRVWNLDAEKQTFIVADKHGGRNRYRDLLADMFLSRSASDGAELPCDAPLILCREESRAVSSYRIGTADIRFETKAETHFPVAVASMVSKYVRELAMMQFNRFWQRHLPGLLPTAGYPVDARRFKHQIAPIQARLGIADETLWRER